MSEVKDYPPYLDYPKPRKKQTNADCIRAYTDEQIAEMLSHFNCPASEHGCSDCYTFKGDCKQCWLDWLKQEVSDNG